MGSDAAFNAFLASVRIALLSAGTLLAADGFITPGILAKIRAWVSVGVVVATAAWAIWNAYVKFRQDRARNVAAGINLALSGKAITDSGDVISNIGIQESTPPKMPTMQTADQIVKDFAPPAGAIKSA